MDVAAQSERGSEEASPFDFALPENAHGELVDIVFAHGPIPLGILCQIQSEGSHGIVPELQTDGVFRIVGAQMPQHPMCHFRTRRPALLELFELIAVDRVVQNVREVVKELRALLAQILSP